MLTDGTPVQKVPPEPTRKQSSLVEERDTVRPLQSAAAADNSTPRRRSSMAAAANAVIASRRLSQDMSLFGQVPWNDISKPRHSFQY